MPVENKESKIKTLEARILEIDQEILNLDEAFGQKRLDSLIEEKTTLVREVAILKGEPLDREDLGPSGEN